MLTVKSRNPLEDVIVEQGSNQTEVRIDLEDRIIERGMAHVKIFKKPNKLKKCDDDVNNIHEKKVPVVDRTNEEEQQAPYVIVVHGPPKVGKSVLVKSLVKYYTDHDETGVIGSPTLVLGNRRRIQLVECPNNVNGMIDAAKYADAVIFLIDARFGFEMETFEFLNILQVHGIPRIIGVLTYLDGIEDVHRQQKIQYLMDQFCAEIYEAAKFFCLSGLAQEMYRQDEIGIMANFIMNMEFHPSSWRAQPYVLTKYFEVDNQEKVNTNGECYRNISLYGYLRGCESCDIKKGNKVYVAGVGDFPLFDVTRLSDPFPLPADTRSRRIFQDKERFEIEGFGTGTFLRLEVRNVPSEMVKNLDPHHPILVGFIGFEEEILGYNQVTLKLHDWHRKLLMTNDPIIVSIGWRRYMTMPTYAKEGCHGRLERLHCTPKDKQCVAMFWGHLAPPGTKAVVVQSLSDDEAAFRILATAVVLSYNHAAKIFKNRRLIGTPCKIFKKTALIQNMFTSDLQVSRYKDKSVRTESGIRGKIVKAIKKMKDGRKRVIAKCRFESQILMSDTVFMSVWKKVEVPCVFNPFMAALKPSSRIWQHTRPSNKVDYPDMPDSERKEEPNSEMGRRLKLCKKIKDSIQEKRRKKFAAGERQTLELQRSVMFFEEVPSYETALKVDWTRDLISAGASESNDDKL